jgi:site-specific DNA-methyltransferase (adenine-specific)
MDRIRIEYMATDRLIPYVNNPRKNDKAVDVVAGSIQEFGFKNPIIVDKDNVIVAGHTRLLAARKLELEEVPVIRAEDLTEQQIKAFRLADNKTAESAEWDMELLALELEGLDDIFTGFNEVEIADILGLDNEAQEDDFDVDAEAEKIIEPETKPGDVWLLSGHRLLCGDATSPDDVARLMNGKKADMVFTDPPYDLDISYAANLFNNYKGHCFVMNTINRIVDLIILNRKEFSRLFVVDFRIPHLVSNSAPMDRVDFIAEFKNSKSKFVNLKDGFSTLIECAKVHSNKAKGNFGHAQAKRVELPAQFIEHYSRKGEIVLDLFGGSGSTLIACEQLNRTCYMMELDPVYVDVIKNRWEHLTGLKAEKTDQGQTA